MKLTRGKLLETIRVLNLGQSKYQARKIAGITKERVYQVWREYIQTGMPPVLGRQVGRPRRPISEQERSVVGQTYERYGVCADALEGLIFKDFGLKIGHNRIHSILLELGFAKPSGRVDVRKKDWIRYERKHSLTAVHIDWHQRPNDGFWVLAIIDDASRKVLVLLEGERPTTEASIRGMELALSHGQIREVISDHGSQFTSNNDGESQFKNWLDVKGIKHILCKVKHPQTNGKIEKWFDLYERKRDRFKTPEEFLSWYNELRPHRALNWGVFETPSQAFERKKAEA